jgi:sialic acid synthase SpsE
LPPKYLEQIIGKVAVQDIKANTATSFELISK